MNDKTIFSSFFPLVLIFLGLIGWVGGEDYQISVERAKITKQITDQEPALNGADAAKARYINFLKDLAVTGEKDQGAKLVVMDAMRAGIIQTRPGPASGSTNAAPATPTP
jgi:hypothetical protein